jgi:hypothetical protein
MDPLIEKAILLSALIIAAGITRWGAWHGSIRVRRGFYALLVLATLAILGLAASRGSIGHLPYDLGLAYTSVFFLAWGWPAFMAMIRPGSRPARKAGQPLQQTDEPVAKSVAE